MGVDRKMVPDIELQEYEMTRADLREYAADLGERLGNVSAVVEKRQVRLGCQDRPQ
jgi:hypothetical protein